MSFWKVLGGVAAGVAVVVALPVAGPIGAITAIGAGIAGTTGAVVGGVASAMDDSEEQAEQKGYEQGYEQGTGESAIKIRKLTAAILEAGKRVKESDNYFNLIIAMTAVGLSCANCDGEVSPEEETEILEFISGASSSGLPSHVTEKLNELAANPPNINTAFYLANKVGLNTLELFDEIIDVVMDADGYTHSQEIAFKQAWNNKVAQAA